MEREPGGVQRDIAHLMTGKPGSLIEFGGLAYVGVACNLPWAYGWSMDGANTVGHEVGHNLGGHTASTPSMQHDVRGCLYVGPNTKDVMNGYLAGQACLDVIASYATPVPPYAYPDTISVLKDSYDALQPARIDVLANDEDGNCNAVRLLDFDTASALGGSVALSPGTGPAGRDELLYQAPSPVFIGKDTLTYDVADGTGLSTVGNVTIEVRPLELSGYWALDDGVGTIATDASPDANNGVLVGPPVWTRRHVLGRARLRRHERLRRRAGAGPRRRGGHGHGLGPAQRCAGGVVGSGLLPRRDDGRGALARRGRRAALHLERPPGSWGFATGLVVPDLTWVFVAVVVERDRGTVYMHDGTLQSATNVMPHAIQPFDGVTRIGWDSAGPVRRLAGSMDDVRIYDHALSAPRSTRS